MNFQHSHPKRTLHHQTSNALFPILKSQKSGFILMMTLFMMVICSILVLSSMQKLLFTFQIQNQLKQKHQAMRGIREAVDTLEASLPNLPKKCFFQGVNPSFMPANWFYEHGCDMVHADKGYHYAIIDLDVFPCVLVQTNGGQQSSHHWWLLLSPQRLPGMIACIRIVTPELHNTCPSNLSTTVVREHLLSQFLLTQK